MDYKGHVVNLLRPLVGDAELEAPKDKKFGDYSFPCFNLAKKLKKSPALIAQDLRDKIKLNKYIIRIEAVGPYLNFFLNKELFNKQVIEAILKQKDKYGSGNKREKIVVEFPSPNTNKPLHLGHIRNILIGESVSRLLGFLGNRVYRVNLNNDRGIHICKSMLAYKKFGRDKKPNKKPDHFVGDFYTLFAKKARENENLENEAQELLRKWEQKDKETMVLWKKLNNWALGGFNETYKKFNLKFDKVYNESEHYEDGKDIILSGLKEGIFYKKSDGAIAINLNQYDLGEKILLRPDGTSIYITQDVNLARLKYKDFKMDKSVFVVGSEQNYHFKVLFKILELLNAPYAKGNHHLSYGMVYLPEGKMKSREGKVVDADDLIDEMQNVAKIEIEKRHESFNKSKLRKKANQIGLAALSFFILKIDPAKDIYFNPKESISFDGDTGPYLQYVHARANSLLNKSKIKKIKGIDYSLLVEKEEIVLIDLLSMFPKVLQESAESLKPNLLANYLLRLASQFNEFYEKYNVLKVEKELMCARLSVVKAVKQVLRTGLFLLLIEALDEM